MRGTAARDRRTRLEKSFIEREWRRCGASVEYFLEEHVWIESKTALNGKEKFKLLPYQRADLRIFTSRRYAVVLKARQLGITTLVMAYALHMLFFRPGSRVLVLSKGQDEADGNLEKMMIMYRNLEKWFQKRAPRVVSASKSAVEFEFADGTKSYIRSLVATRTSGASNTADLVILDEFALAEYQDEAYKSVHPTTLAAASNVHTTGCVMIVLSTARGQHNKFAQLYRAAARGSSDFAPIFHSWKESPFITEEFYEQEKRNWAMAGTPWMIHSEYPNDPEEAFRESGGARFQGLIPEKIEEYPFRGDFVETVEPITERRVISFKPDPEGPLRALTLDVHPGAFYVLGVDGAEGKGQDYTVGNVLMQDENGDVTTVAVWSSNVIEPVTAAAHLDRLGRYYKGRQSAALMAPENQAGYGALLIHQLTEIHNYPNMYRWTPLNGKSKTLDRNFGMAMARGRKPHAIGILADRLPFHNGLDEITRSELASFVLRPDGKLEADHGCHDDEVMALAIAYWVMTERGSAAHPARGEEIAVDDPLMVDVMEDINKQLVAIQRVVARDTRKFQRDIMRSHRRRSR